MRGWKIEEGREEEMKGPFNIGSQCCLSERTLKLSCGYWTNSLRSTSLDGECLVDVGNVCNGHA